MKIVLIISALLTIAAAQQPIGLTCNYFFSFDTYRCELTINNPNGADDFTEIGGIHLEGYSDANVTYIYRTAGSSPNVPSIICNTFPNLLRVMFYNSGLVEITDSSFGECTQIVELDLVFNRIFSISANALANMPDLQYFYMEDNQLRTLPETLFANQQDLLLLDLSYNPLNEIPANVFQPLSTLRTLYLGFANIETINNQWFTSNDELDYLYLAGNRIVLASDSFAGLESLTFLNLASNAISVIPTGTFTPLTSLQYLYLYNNNFTELAADSFPNLGQLVFLDLSENPTVIVQDGAFRGLTNLTSLSISNSRLRELRPNSFEGLENVATLQLNFNEIEELPPGVFVPLESLVYVGMWNNRLKTLRRSSFGNIANLQTLDLDGNIVNAIDRAIIDEAVNLNTLYFSGNLCASNYFGSFLVSRTQYLPMLQSCFDNMRFIVGKTCDNVTLRPRQFRYWVVIHLWGVNNHQVDSITPR